MTATPSPALTHQCPYCHRRVSDRLVLGIMHTTVTLAVLSQSPHTHLSFHFMSTSLRCVVPQGVMAGLDRRYFTVAIFCIVNSNMYLNPDVLNSGDEVYHVPLAREEGNRVWCNILMMRN